MKINKKRGFVAGGIAGVMMLIAPAAYAASTLIVDGSTTPGQVSVTGVSNRALEFKTTGWGRMDCAVSSIVGKVNRGASATAGSVLGQIDNLAFGTAGTPCTATSLFVPVIIQKSPSFGSWDVEFTATPAKGSVTAPIVIRDVAFKLSSMGAPPWLCDLQAEGDVTGTFDQVTQRITINTPPAYPLDLTTFNGAGTQTPAAVTCLGTIGTTHSANVVGSFTLTTPGVGGIHW